MVRAARLWCGKSPYRVSSRLGCAMRRLENSLCQPSRKWVPFSNKGRISSERRGMGSAFHQLCPRYSGTLAPTAPTAIKLWDTFTFTFFFKVGKPSETDSIKSQISSKTSRGKRNSIKRHHRSHHQRQQGEQLFPIHVVTG